MSESIGHTEIRSIVYEEPRPMESPGFYIDGDGDLWFCSTNGWMLCVPGGVLQRCRPDGRLTPVTGLEVYCGD